MTVKVGGRCLSADCNGTIEKLKNPRLEQELGQSADGGVHGATYRVWWCSREHDLLEEIKDPDGETKPPTDYISWA